MIFPLLGAAVIALLIWRGPLRPGSLDGAPRRNVRLTVHHLLWAMMLMIMGSLLVAGLVQTFWPQVADGQGAAALNDLDYTLILWLGQATLFPVVGLIIWLIAKQPRGAAEFGLKPARPWRDIALGLGACAAAIPVVLAIMACVMLISILWVEPPPPVQHEMLERVMQVESPWVLLAMFASAVAAAPICEEIIYRGLFQNVLVAIDGAAKRPWAVVIISSCWFTLAHSAVNWQALPALFVLGLFLGWLYERTGSLLPSIVLHMSFNAFNFLWVAMRQGT